MRESSFSPLFVPIEGRPWLRAARLSHRTSAMWTAVEEVGHVPFIFGVPSFKEGVAELGEDGVGAVVGVDDHDVVDVASEDKAVSWLRTVVCEDAGVGVASGEALCD